MGNLTATEILLKSEKISEKIKVNKADARGNTALMLGVLSGDTDTVKVLLAARNMNVNAMNKSGHTALMIAAIWADVKMVEILVDAPNLNVTKKNRLGQSALTFASSKDHTAIVDLILKASVNKLLTQASAVSIKAKKHSPKSLLPSPKPVTFSNSNLNSNSNSKKSKERPFVSSKKASPKTTPRNFTEIPVLVR
jgi:ankyrin repeat protein